MSIIVLVQPKDYSCVPNPYSTLIPSIQGVHAREVTIVSYTQSGIRPASAQRRKLQRKRVIGLKPIFRSRITTFLQMVNNGELFEEVTEEAFHHGAVVFQDGTTLSDFLM